jgi:hypothetical protein
VGSGSKFDVNGTLSNFSGATLTSGMYNVSFRQACVDEPGTPALAPRIHNSDAFFSPKIEPLAFFFHAVSG